MIREDCNGMIQSHPDIKLDSGIVMSQYLEGSAPLLNKSYS
jgi:hypothetical protein